MATFYGGWVATDDFRAILEATVSNTSATQCTVKLVVKIQSNYAYASSSGRASATCNGTTRSASVSYSAGKTTTLMTESFTVARGSSSKSISVSGKVWQLNSSSAYSKGSTASGKVTIPAIDYDAPSAPSSCAASRVSDTSAKVTWTNGGTTTLKPRSSVKVERQTDGGSWSQIANVGASTTNYTDNSISSNHRYAYRVRSYGAGGYSGYSTSGYIYTTPAAPSSVSITKTSGTQVRLTAGTSSAPYATSWEVQESLNGGSWTAVGSFTTFPQTVDVGGGTAKLRVRAVRGSLASAWAESNTVTTIVAPNAPTIVSKPASVVATGSTLKVGWTRNHPDGTAQTSAQVGYTVDSGAETVATVTGSASTYTLPASVSAKACAVKVRVRTKGLAEGWGAWSSYYSFTVAVPPEAHFTAPGVDGAKIGDLPLTVAWEVVDETGVAAQTLQLTDEAGRVLHTANPSTGAREYELGASTYQLANATSYRLVLTVRGGSSLTVTTTRDFATSFAEPSRPSADVELDESAMSQAVTVHAGPSTSDTGEVIEVSATPGTLVPGFEVYGKTRQNLWVNPSGRGYGVTVTSNEDGSVTLSGTSTQICNFEVTVYSIRPGTTYTLSIDKAVPGLTSGYGFYFDTARTGTKCVGNSQYQTENTFVAPGDAVIATLGFYIPAGVTVSGTYRVMLNEGSTAEPWCPPGLNSVGELSIVTAGKNLFDVATGTANGVTLSKNNDGTYTLSGTCTAVTFFRSSGTDGLTSEKAFPDGTYALSVSVDGSHSKTLFFRSRNTSGAIIGQFDQASGNGVWTLKDISCFEIAVPDGFSGDVVIRVQVERGSTATAYEPPAVTSTPVDLDGHTLNSLPDGTRDELRIDGTGALTLVQRVGVAIAPTDVGSWSWSTEVTGGRASFHAGKTPVSITGEQAGHILCDKLPPRTDDIYGPSYVVVAPNSRVYVRNPAITNTAMAASLTGGMTVLYPLAAPQTVELDGTVVMPEFPADPTTMWAVSDVPATMAVVYPETSSMSVTRVLADGSRWLVADGLADGEQAIDPLPPLNVPYSYEVAASTAAGATSEARVTETIRALVGAFNFGLAAGTCELAELDPDWSHDVARSGTLYHFADGGEGGGLPVAYGGQDVDATRSMGFTLLDIDQLRRMQELAREYFTCWYRDPYGGRALCSVSWSFSSGIPYGKLDVSASMTETVFEEAW